MTWSGTLALSIIICFACASRDLVLSQIVTGHACHTQSDSQTVAHGSYANKCLALTDHLP